MLHVTFSATTLTVSRNVNNMTVLKVTLKFSGQF